MSTAIEFNNISKQYRLGVVSGGTIRADFQRWWTMNIRRQEDPFLKVGETNDRSSKGLSEYVWALKDIDFKVEQGDVVGIIGKNGAGKSTLLKILSRVTGPTTGSIRARGRIGSLLEVGTGFHPEMTGRENIFLNGAILGMTKPEIARKLDEIVNFSGCERYIDTPVKRYSSGMMVRLGFAVAAHLDPEILVVDEVLAVGDAEFQKKAIGKMQDVSKGEGRTVLFVSHNMNAVRNLCKSGVVLRNGQICHMGTASDCIDFYMADKTDFREEYVCKKNDVTKEAYISKIYFEDGNNVFNTVDDLTILVDVKSNKTISNCRINMTISGVDDVPIGTVIASSTFSIGEGEEKTIKLIISNHNLTMGAYNGSFSVGVGTYNESIRDFDILMNAIQFKIEKYSSEPNAGYMQWSRNWGSIYLPHKIEVL